VHADAGDGQQSGASRRPRFLLPLLSFLIGFGAPLLLAEVVLRFLPRSELPPLLAVIDTNPRLRFAPRPTSPILLAGTSAL
jgi:hypothetical protein